MTSAAGDHAILVRQADTPRVLLLGEPGSVASTGRERVVVMPFDDDVETRVDGDALATWIAGATDARPGSGSGPGDAGASGRVPAWASAFGFVLVVVVLALAVLGGAVAFGWLLDLAGT